MKQLLNLVALALSLSLTLPVSVQAQQKFGYREMTGPAFQQKSVTGVRSMADGEHYTSTGISAATGAVSASGNPAGPGAPSASIKKYSYKTGEEVATIFESSRFPEMKGAFGSYEFSPDEKKILLGTNLRPIYRHSAKVDNWVYDLATERLVRLTPEGGEQEATFSADGKRVAFVRDNNLYYTDLVGGTLHSVTTDGEFNKIINGHTDWVYEEEFGFTRAFEISPDGNRIAYLRFDESHVREYTMMIYGKNLYPRPYTYKYPKAGEANSLVELYVYDIAAGTRTRVDIGPESDQYIPRIGWTPWGELFFCRTNRLQNHLELLLADAEGRSRVIYEERDPRYVEMVDEKTIMFLADRRFLIRSERSGYAHLYVHDIKKGDKATRTVTSGDWEVTSLVDVVGDRVYYMSTEGSPLRRNLFSVRLDGKDKKRLTEGDGTFRIAPSKGFNYFISSFSNVSTPLLVRLHDSSGRVVRTLEDNAKLRQTLSDLGVPRKEFFSFTTEQGITLNGYTIRPADFDPSKSYPVIMTQYSGPGSQQVLDSWSLDWTDVMVQHGYIVACVDGRGTGGRGADFRKSTYGNLGALETVDQLEAAKYMAGLPYVDPARIGIYGWSFGGFMALNCILKGADLYKMAIAVAPVTSWRFYDTIYTELYNGLPQDNPGGYDNNSPINFAANLRGTLLIAHGTADDNVHLQNTYEMARALVGAGKQFDMMIYPDDNHSMVPGGRRHVREYMIDYTLENL